MKITYSTLNTNGEIINTMSKAEIKAFSVKLKVVRLQKWLVEEVELLNKFHKEIETKFNIKESFSFDDEGKFIGENREELLKVIAEQKVDIESLMQVEIEIPNISFTEEELSEINLKAEDIFKLSNLELFKI